MQPKTKEYKIQNTQYERSETDNKFMIRSEYDVLVNSRYLT